MALFLIHCTPHGEPVGIWDDAGHHVYADQRYEKRGQMVFDDKGTKAPWSQWVEDLTHTPPHVSLWKSEDSPATPLAVLEDARTMWFKSQKLPDAPADSTKGWTT